MVDVKNIVLSNDELIKCETFARTSAPNQQAIEFGQRTTKARDSKEIARDNLIGKIAEVAFSKMMKENYGIDVPLDFNYYPRGKWDDQDAVINGWRIDIKGTRTGGRWMLIEWNKLCFRQRDNNLSHVYAMFSVDWDREHDLPTGRVRFEGVASIQRLCSDDGKTQVLKKGMNIPGTNTRLQADNFAIRFGDLYKHLNHFVKFITSEPPSPSLTDDFKNPYTGQTTLEIIRAAKTNVVDPLSEKPAPDVETERPHRKESKFIEIIQTITKLISGK